MLMEDKKILVFYVGVSDMPDNMVGQYIKRVKDSFLTEDFAIRNHCEMILIPTRNIDSSIECINPKYIIEQELVTKHGELMKDYLATLDKFIKDQKSNG